MSDATVIGLGAMGAAIARALLADERKLTLWNRSRERLEAFADTPARCEPALAAALSASPVVVVCVDDYAASGELLAAAGDGAVAGRTILQFTTGTPGEARAAEAWAAERGARWLDGAILAYPREIGDDGLIYVSGSEAAERECRALLAALSSNARYLGRAVGAAAALDLAVLSYYLGAHMGLVHAALICRAESVSPELLTSVIVDSQPSDADELANLGRALAQDRYDNPGASLGVYAGVVRRVLAHADDAGINDEIPALVADLIGRGIDAGLADEEIVALVRVLRGR